MALPLLLPIRHWMVLQSVLFSGLIQVKQSFYPLSLLWVCLQLWPLLVQRPRRIYQPWDKHWLAALIGVIIVSVWSICSCKVLAWASSFLVDFGCDFLQVWLPMITSVSSATSLKQAERFKRARRFRLLCNSTLILSISSSICSVFFRSRDLKTIGLERDPNG